MSSVETAIDYFVTKKFGIVSALAPMMANFEVYKNGSIPKQVVEIKEYERTLRNVPTNELLTLHKQSLIEDSERAKQNAIKEEKARFYNLQLANADFVHWSKAAHWTLDEAIALSFGKEPEHVTWKKIEPLKDKTSFAKAYAKRRDLALRATRWKKFSNETIPPVLFISWAKEVKIELPLELINELEKIGHTATNWREKYYELQTKLESVEKQAPDNTQKTENLLKAVASMAIDGYGYDPKSPKSDVPKEISEALKKQGKAVDPKTIRGWIKDGLELLPRKAI